jgi:hypothetical protein
MIRVKILLPSQVSYVQYTTNSTLTASRLVRRVMRECMGAGDCITCYVQNRVKLIYVNRHFSGEFGDIFAEISIV